jgi:SHS2 domain-containing protein
MMAYLFGDDILKARPEQTEMIRVEAADREALLVDWLSELLYRATSQFGAVTHERGKAASISLLVLALRT